MKFQGAERKAAATEAKTLYDMGMSIREIASEKGYSYAFTRGLLLEAGVRLRRAGKPGGRR
jgi:hypothetical protein